jgi:phenylpyruvate tautomerase PptA (4-oxalocrotonate tautomerase family)
MPTVTIDTPALPSARRRDVAVRLTRWQSDRGVPPAHTIVRFTETQAGTVFSGGMPIDALPAGGSALRHASVTACIGPDRDDAFRAALAAEITDALGATDETPFLTVEFRPTRPSDVYAIRRGTPMPVQAPDPADTRGATSA